MVEGLHIRLTIFVSLSKIRSFVSDYFGRVLLSGSKMRCVQCAVGGRQVGLLYDYARD